MYNLGNADKNELIRIDEENKYYDSSIHIDINDNNNTHSIIAKYIKKGTRVLDVGCGAGYIGALLGDKTCEVYGIDLDSKACEVALASNSYKEVFNFSITDTTSEEYKNFFNKNIKFDYIIFADVIEHINDIGGLLFEFSKLLDNNGEILTSIPNVAHFDILRGIANRKFNYNKIGLLDNTHIRFFTKNSFVEMIESFNKKFKMFFKIKEIGKTYNTPLDYKNYPNMNKYFDKDGDLYVLQYVYSLGKKIKTNIKIEKKYYFEEMEVELSQNELKYNESFNLNKEYKKKLKEKEMIIEEIDKEKKKLEEELNKIYNSKAWKCIEKYRMFMGRIRRK